MTSLMRAFAAVALVAASGALSVEAAAAEKIKIGVLTGAAAGPVSIAKERGYFAAEGIDAELVGFDTAQPIAVAAVSGAVDFGAADLTSALYTLATQGVVRLIAGLTHEGAGFHDTAIVVSSNAAAELRTFDDLPGHAGALTQLGSTFEYAMAIACEKHGIDLKTMHFVALQSLSNVAAAVAGGQESVGVLDASTAQPLVAKGDAKILAWVGDETPWQVAAVWISARTADDRPKIVEGFLRALRKASHDFHGGGVDPDDRLDVDDIQRQIDWYRGQGVLRGEVDTDALIDKRYVMPLPSR
jgi:NitT/TauT family transport system substrate-binding protein